MPNCHCLRNWNTDVFCVWCILSINLVNHTTVCIGCGLCCRTEDYKLSTSGNIVTLTLGTAGERFRLHKVNSADRSTELSSLLFSVTERCTELEKRLADAERTVESLKRSADNSVNAHVSVFDMTVDSKKKKTQPKMQPKQAGMSIVNPGSRKRTQAKGVQFD